MSNELHDANRAVVVGVNGGVVLTGRSGGVSEVFSGV